VEYRVNHYGQTLSGDQFDEVLTKKDKMEFILNKTLGINGIDRISFKKIIEIL